MSTLVERYRIPATTHELTLPELAYLAGIVDGEGTITFSKTQHKENADGRYATPTVQIANTSNLLLEWIKSRTPIGVSYYQYKRKETFKPCYALQWRSRFAVQLMRLLEPHLVIKREQAQIVIATYEVEEAALQALGQTRWYRYNPMPDHLSAARMNAFARVQELNRRGA